MENRVTLIPPSPAPPTAPPRLEEEEDEKYVEVASCPAPPELLVWW